MKKKFSYTESKGLPGGPNEMFTYVTGIFSTEGYKRNSPDKNNPFNIIPSGNITMKDVDFPVLGIDNKGNKKLMKPGNNYKFPGDMVFEVPIMQDGGVVFDKEDITPERIEQGRQRVLDYYSSPGYLKLLRNSYENPEQEQLERINNVKTAKVSDTGGINEYTPKTHSVRFAPNYYKDLTEHEFLHAGTKGPERISENEKFIISMNVTDPDREAAFAKGLDPYIEIPEEYQARLGIARMLMQHNNMFDYNTETFTQEHLDRIKKDMEENPKRWNIKGFQDVMKSRESDDALIEVMNTIAQNTQSTQNNNLAQDGKEIKYNWDEVRKKSPSFIDNFKEESDFTLLRNDVLQKQAFAESSFEPDESSAGAKGLTQFMPDTIEELRRLKLIDDTFDINNPADAVDAQKKYMKNLYNRDWINKEGQDEYVRMAKTLAAYNWGPGNMNNFLNRTKESGKDIYNSLEWMDDLPAETRNYINMILFNKNPKGRKNFQRDYSNAIKNPKYEKYTKLYQQKGGETKLLEIYKDYMNGNYDKAGMKEKALKVYDKLNRVYYKKAKDLNMTAPNYIMTYLVED